MNLTAKEYSVIYDAVRYYQINKTTTSSKDYWDCDSILTKLHDKRTINGIEPAYRSDS